MGGEKVLGDHGVGDHERQSGVLAPHQGNTEGTQWGRNRMGMGESE